MLLLGGFPAICCNIGRFLLISAEETLAACMSPCEPVYEGEVGSNLDRIERTLYARSHRYEGSHETHSGTTNPPRIQAESPTTIPRRANPRGPFRLEGTRRRVRRIGY